MKTTDAIRPAALSPQRERVLAFLRAERQAGRGFASREKICTHMGWKNVSSVVDVLNTLAGSGHLERRRSGNRYIFSLNEPLELPHGDPRHAAWVQHWKLIGNVEKAVQAERFRRPITVAACWPPETPGIETLPGPVPGQVMFYIPPYTPEWASHVAALRLQGKNGQAQAQAMEVSKREIRPYSRWGQVKSEGE